MKYPFNIKKNLKNPREIGYIKEIFKDATIENFEFLITELLEKGGWKFVEEDDWGATWQKDFINVYRSTIHAIIGYKRTHLDMAWQYGVQWLEGEHEYQDQLLGMSDIKDITEALRLALADLLAIGIPYHPESDIAHNEDFYGLSYYDIKRNVDLLNATRLLEINCKAVLRYIFEGDKESMGNAIQEGRDYRWLRKELAKEENEEWTSTKERLGR